MSYCEEHTENVGNTGAEFVENLLGSTLDIVIIAGNWASREVSESETESLDPRRTF